MEEFKETSQKETPQKFKVSFPDREKGETSKDYYQKAISENIKKVLEKNKIQTTPEIEADFKEITDVFGQDLGNKAETSIIDPLTNFYNRRYFEETGKDRMAESKRYKVPLVFGYIDLDNFKALNDECGHDAGDKFLQIFSDLLKNNLRREEDICARVGGDEFGFIMFASDLSRARLVIENLKTDIKTFIDEGFGNLSRPLGFSVGMETWDGKKDITQIMKTADEKLYKEKKQKYG